MSPPLDRERLLRAFRLLGQHLAGRGVFVELAVYGGSAIMLQFAWRRATEDVDAVVREGYDEAALAPSVAAVSEQLGFDPDWLNDAVGMFTPLAESDALFALAGTYPETGVPGLRVLVAKPHDLLAMKLKALAAVDRGDRDLSDARAPADHLGFNEVESLRQLYLSVHGEAPRDDVEPGRVPHPPHLHRPRPAATGSVPLRSRGHQLPDGLPAGAGLMRMRPAHATSTTPRTC